MDQMSGTLSNGYNNVNFALHLNSEAMTRLQEQASTGSQVNRTSDDPSTAYRVLGLNSQVKSLENYGDHISDAIAVLRYAFQGMPASVRCEDSADVSDNGEVGMDDALHIINHLFGSGPPPAMPQGRSAAFCGPDRTPDDLGCVEYSPCGF